MDERYELVEMVVEREKGITASFADGHVAAFALSLGITLPELLTHYRDLINRMTEGDTYSLSSEEPVPLPRA